MKLVPLLIAAGAIGVNGLAKPAISARSDYALKEFHPVPPRWTNIGPAPKDSIIHLEIGLKQSQFDELERHLYEVSDPDHSRYGQHLKEADVLELVKPTDEAFDLVHAWLREHGIETHHVTYSPGKDWINVPLPVSAVEALLDTEYSVFQHEDGIRVIRTPQWSLPEYLHEHIDVIAPTNSFFRALPQAKIHRKRDSTYMPVSAVGQNLPLDFGDSSRIDGSEESIKKACNFAQVTPTCLRTLYGTIKYKPKVPGKNRVALANYLGEANNRSDVQLFLKQFRPDAVSAAYDFKVNIINDGDNQQTPNTPAQLAAGKDLEGNLDAEYIIGISYPTPLQTYNTGGSPPFIPDENTPTNTNEPYLAWTKYILAQSDKKIPYLVSTSYGDDEQTVPASFSNRVCKGYAQLGARGVTLLFSAGDSGVGPTGACKSNTGKPKRMFIPSFSSTCPYVTSVGGTKNFPEEIAYDPRNGYSPGGGFSNRYDRPKYQDEAVDKFLDKLGNKYKGLYNKKGRAYPDISAQGQSFVVTWNGTNVLLDGTSASAPTAAGVLSLVNDALIHAKRPPLGFMNPWLYKKGYKGFNDITKGTNLGCNTDGFPAIKGWDAASGWGTPNFKKILTELALPF